MDSQLRVSCCSFSVSAVGQVTHLQPDREVALSVLLVHLRCPLYRPEHRWYFPQLLRLLKQQSCSRLCVSSQSWAEAVPAPARGFFDTQPRIYQLSINNRLIKRSTSKSTIPLCWFAVTDSSLGFLSCGLFQFMALPVSQAEWKLCLEGNWPACRDKLSP